MSGPGQTTKTIILLLLLLHPFNGLFSRTTQVSWYQKGKISLDLNEARYDGVLGCTGISYICKQSASRSRQITTPTPHHSILTGWMLFLVPNPQCQSTQAHTHTSTHTHTHTFNSPLSGTTQVSRYQKGKTNLDFIGARDSEWQWHQLGHMQIYTSLQTNNHTSTPPLSFFTGRMPFMSPNQQCQSNAGNKKQIVHGSI